jgi:hypothetical protein
MLHEQEAQEYLHFGNCAVGSADTSPRLGGGTGKS